MYHRIPFPRGGKRGHAVIELVLLSPWIFFLFVGAFDIGFYTYALIATQNAARVGAEYTSKTSSTAADSSGACQYALDEMSTMSNVKGLSNCNGLPLIVTASSVTDPDGFSGSSVTVKYKTSQLIPIPGLMGQLTVSRTVQMMMR